MNHFELYDIPVAFQVDAALLNEKREALSHRYDPDVAGLTDQERDAMQARRAQVQQAYEIFQDEEATVHYVLRVRHLLEEGYRPDPEFQLEVMDLDEELMELELDEKKELLMDVEQKATRLILKTYDDVAEIMETYRGRADTEEALLQVKEFYYRKKYLQRILDRIKVIRNIASPQ